ncbi:aromatic ring-hydroxylating dioxygenase subunit alpha [Pedobacter sp. HDW13]|uniref:aromatic ring-hydroxylating oxygenase subunit alpha n=1 Tax=Pedobacter sp. HDW13 TaxID=2714940 RepID=UPI00140BF946|nr:aromatic ring-hydroxylating dioxygenase subunit alpha [Pedobacter sp. HDW13]QIL39197.1 aromatic ring-hydroxylating dioxygenase subunit alpha [Pedobacter sp. HDW13]
MKAIITPKYYFEPSLYTEEQNKIFSTTWMFVGFTNDLANPNDFLTVEIAGIPVAVQNLKGEIKAFKNVCSHRFSIIHTEKSGNRPFVCPYHGWAYNEEGIPTGIPKKPYFEFSDEDLKCLRLEQYQLETCGTLIFIKIKPDEVSLRQYLASYYPLLEEMSNAFGELVDVNEMLIGANWKVVVENTLESYHVNLIHKDSFRKLGTSGLNFEFIDRHSAWNTGLKFEEEDSAVKAIHKPYKERPFVMRGYKHMIVFPNVLISSTYGISFNLSVVTPVDENTSLFRSYVFITKKDSGKEKGALEEAYENSLKDFNRTVFAEDKFICEKVQQGVKYTSYNGELSEEETRVCKFQESYKALMS